MKKIVLAVAALALCAPLASHAAPAGDTTSVRVSYRDLDLSRSRDARTMLARLQEAALNTCGASGFSFPQYREAVRRSDCYQQSLSNAVAALDVPTVSARYNAQTAVTVAAN